MPFECSQCGKSYKQERTLRQHFKAAHTGEKPVECNQSGKCYNLAEDLKHHKATCSTETTCGNEKHDSVFSIAELLSNLKEIKQE